MKNVIIAAVFIVMSAVGIASAANAPEQWNEVESGVRDLVLSKKAAQDELRRLRPMLDEYYTARGCVVKPYAGVFPVAGYRLSDADLKGYIDRGYDFFSGLKHNDHPAVDIFIFDRNHDCLDDRTKMPVNVLSMSPGIVTSTYNVWEPGNKLRGGNSVWIYDPVTKGLFYYAHMGTVAVWVGKIVQPGDIIGTVGRTGTHAYAKRSQTHLHIMYLKYQENGYPVPENISKLLIAAGTGKTTVKEKFPDNSGN